MRASELNKGEAIAAARAVFECRVIVQRNPCCGICNRAKSDLSEDAFIAWVDRIVANKTQWRAE